MSISFLGFLEPKLNGSDYSSCEVRHVPGNCLQSVDELQGLRDDLGGAMEGHLVGGRGLRPPDGDAFVEDDDVDEEVLVEKPDDEVRELLGPGQLWPDHRLSDVDDDDDVHRVNVELGQGRRSVVEVGEEGVLCDHVGLSVEVDVVLQRQVAGEALVAEGVELKIGNDQHYFL